jgi:hypothetical protein
MDSPSKHLGFNGGELGRCQKYKTREETVKSRSDPSECSRIKTSAPQRAAIGIEPMNKGFAVLKSHFGKNSMFQCQRLRWEAKGNAE